MTTTDLIALLKKHERGGATGRPREISFVIGHYDIFTPKIEVNSTGDGLFTEIYLELVPTRKQTEGDKIRFMNNEELAEYFFEREILIAEKIFKELNDAFRQRGFTVTFLKNFHPDKKAGKEWWLKRFSMEVDTDAESN